MVDMVTPEFIPGKKVVQISPECRRHGRHCNAGIYSRENPARKTTTRQYPNAVGMVDMVAPEFIPGKMAAPISPECRRHGRHCNAGIHSRGSSEFLVNMFLPTQIYTPQNVSLAGDNFSFKVKKPILSQQNKILHREIFLPSEISLVMLDKVKAHYPNAVSSSDFILNVYKGLSAYGLTPDQILLAHSICSDDVNNIEYRTDGRQMLGPFNLGWVKWLSFYRYYRHDCICTSRTGGGRSYNILCSSYRN